MKKLVAVVLLIAVMLTSAAIGESMVAYALGEFQYSIPTTWTTDIDTANGYNYHYEFGDVISGVYMMAAVTEIESNKNNVNILFDTMTKGVLESDNYTDYKPIESVKCDGIGDLPYRAFSAKLDIDGLVLEMIYYWWSDWNNVYNIVMSDPTKSLDEAVQSLESILSTVKEKEPDPLPNSRKNPANIGEKVYVQAEKNGLEYTMSVKVDEFYRGNSYVEFAGDSAKEATENTEYVAVKVTITFESIDSINVGKIGTDDPEILVDEVWHFNSYTSGGTRYDNVHYSIRGKNQLMNVFEGASTTGYFQFEVNKDDPAPMLVYEPEYDCRAWLSLK